MRKLIKQRILAGTIFLIACLFMLTAMNQAGEDLLVLHVRDFGATSASDNVYDALRSAVAAATDAGVPAEIRFEKDAVYRISPPDNSLLSDFAIRITGAENLVINGQGSTLLITHPEVGGICTENSSNIAIRDLFIDYDPLPYALGTISEVNFPEGWFELKVDPGFMEPDQPCFERAKAKWGLTIREEEDGGRRYGPTAVFTSGWEKTGERLWRFHVVNEGGGYTNPLGTSGMKAGESYIHMARNYAQAVAAIQCDQLLWENITVYASPGLAFYPHITSHHTIHNCHVKVKEGRLFSTNADGIHMRGSRGHVIIDSCSFEGMADDGINVHSSAMSIAGQPSLDKILVRKHSYSVSPGDTLVLVYSEKAEVGTTMKVTEVQEEGWNWLLTLDRELPLLATGEGFESSDNLYNLSEAANPFVIRNCHFGDYRGRGILVSAHGGLIENNVFDLREGWSVIFNYESTRWAEGPIAYDVTVRNNECYGNGNFPPAILSILYARQQGSDSLATSSGKPFHNLRIEGNRFYEYGRPAIELSSARDVTLHNNQIICSEGTLRPYSSYASVLLKNCENVGIDSLWVSDQDIRHYAAVDIDADCSPGNTIAVKELQVDAHQSSQKVVDHRASSKAVGAIRWDAWVGDMGQPGLETEESLGPPEYHWKAPFYSVILDDYHIQARATTQAVIDDEIKYASEAGIDYFAYVYYTDALSTALNLHFSSARKEDVKFCMIIEISRFTSSVVTLLANNYFKKSFYKTVNIEGLDRPLLYLFSCDTNTASLVASLRSACAASGVNTPYIVAMNSHTCDGVGYDAVSNYAVSGSGGASYSSLVSKAVDTWNKQKNAGNKVIPLVTSGWDPRSRMRTRNPVSWWDPDTSSWTVPGTAVEIANHLQDGIDWVSNNPITAEAKAILIYAWNEFSEGGWICPTLGEGDTRLEEIAKVLVHGDGNRVSGPEAITIPPPAPLPPPGPGGFLENPGFESGDYQSGTDDWSAQSCTLQKVWKTFTRSGEQAIKVTNRTSAESSPNQNITNDLLVNGQGEYYASVYARRKKGSDRICISIKLIDDSGIHWLNTPYTSISSAYTKIGGTLNLTWTGTLQTAEIFVLTEVDKRSDLFLDDFYCDRKPPELLPDPAEEDRSGQNTD